MVRFSIEEDKFSKDGGAEKVLTSELQSIENLNLNLIKIRSAIMKANLENNIVIDGASLPIYSWLVWRKEVFNVLQRTYEDIWEKTKQEVDKSMRTPQVVKDNEGKVIELARVIPNMNHVECQKIFQKISETNDSLDGKLSLANATIVIEF